MATSALVDHSPELLKDADSLETIRLYVSSYSRALPTLTALAMSVTVKEVWLESAEDDEKVGLICRDVFSRCSSLETLTLDLTECSDNGIKDVAKLMSRKGSKLSKIELRLNNVSEEGAGHLAQALLRSSISDFEICATQLDHHDKCIGDKGVALICEAATLADGACKLSSLGITQSRLKSTGLMPIMKLLEPNQTLLKLDLHSNNLDCEASNLLASKLSQKECHLTHLILDGNSMIKNDGTSTIALSLHSNVSLESLSLRSCSIGKEGAESLAIALCNNKNLKSLILDGNVEIRNEGTEHLAQGIKGNTSLDLLDLSSCSIGDLGCSTLAASLLENATLRSLLLRKNEISAGGVLALSHALSTHGPQALTSLVLTENRLDDSAVASLMDSLQHNTTLVNLELDTPTGGTATGVWDRRNILEIILTKNKQLYQHRMLIAKLRAENKLLLSKLQSGMERQS